MSSKYEVKFGKRAIKQIRDLVKTRPSTFKQKLNETIAVLGDNPFISVDDGRRYRPKKLENGRWAVRVDQNHRLEYAIAGQIVHIISVSDRRDAYKS